MMATEKSCAGKSRIGRAEHGMGSCSSDPCIQCRGCLPPRMTKRLAATSPQQSLQGRVDAVECPDSQGNKPMVDGTSNRSRLARSLGWDGKLVVLSVATILSSAVIYAAWAAYSAWVAGLDLSLLEALNRFLSGLVYMLGFAVVAVPLIGPCMLIGWTVGWVAGGAIRLPALARASIAAALLGGSAVLPVAYFFGRVGYAAENEWRILVLPLLWIVPISAVLASQIVFRRRLRKPA